MNDDFLIGRKAIAKEFPFGWHTFLERLPQLKQAGVILGPRAFGSPPHRRIMLYSKRTIIDRFLIENPTF
jgi:hypothetical protein